MIPTLDYDFGGPSARAACAKNIPAISEAGDSRYGLQGIGRCLFNQFPSGSEAAIGATFAGIVYRVISADEPAPVEIAGDVRKAKA